MKQSLQLRLGQHLTMTPQLQQAIRLLQLSTLDLQSEIQEALETNPMLEVNEGEGEGSGGDEGWESPTEAAASATSETESAASAEAGETPATSDSQDLAAENLQDIPDELPVDSNWEDVYDSLPTSSASSISAEDQQRMFENQSGGG